MSLHLVYVSPAATGWSVATTATDGPLMFSSGRRAEEQGRRLALCLAALGHNACLIVRDRAGVVVARISYVRPDEAAAVSEDARLEDSLGQQGTPGELLLPIAEFVLMRPGLMSGLKGPRYPFEEGGSADAA